MKYGMAVHVTRATPLFDESRTDIDRIRTARSAIAAATVDPTPPAAHAASSFARWRLAHTDDAQHRRTAGRGRLGRR